jgi:K+-transporting ATPase KdpF subunit
MTALYWLCGILAVLLLVYLLAALFNPEDFA